MEPARRSQRLFFALWPDAQVRGSLASLTVALPAKAGRAVPAENQHVTLVFLGGVTSEQRQCVERAADALRATPFSLQLSHCGYWSQSRIAWLGTRTIPAELTALHAALAAGAQACGVRVDSRPYAPHVTIMRDARRSVFTDPPVAIHWEVQSFVLAESQTASAGVHYEVLKTWALC
ncbi:MAG: RNA 2',3'-cyclic phosphodiesterase [Chromatiales bacterium]